MCLTVSEGLSEFSSNPNGRGFKFILKGADLFRTSDLTNRETKFLSYLEVFTLGRANVIGKI